MTKVRGEDIVLYVETSTGVYTLIGGQTGFDINRAATDIDLSCKDSGDAQGAAGKRSSTITVNTLHVLSDAAMDKLELAYEAGSNILVRKYVLGVAKKQALSYITGIDESSGDDEAATKSVSLKLTGPWSDVA